MRKGNVKNGIDENFGAIISIVTEIMIITEIYRVDPRKHVKFIKGMKVMQ